MRIATYAILLLGVFVAAAADRPREQDLVRVSVVRVPDGDTIEVKPATGRSFEVRLDDIDAPEYDQPHAEVATGLLRNALMGKDVFLDIKATDRYGRKIAWVFDDQGRDVNLALVKAGAVWVDRRFPTRPSMIPAEDAARAAGLGLWGLPERDRIPPWEWRERR
ncbi:MAG: thermonuclease family protein [Planctomycetota bacterium]